MGESFYNPQLRSIIEECEAKGLVKEDKGAKCIFIKGIFYQLARRSNPAHDLEI
jgi:arginyl-tRNA synthetase